MTKVVYNNCYGGYGLSSEALQLLGIEKSEFNKKYDLGSDPGLQRHNPELIKVVEFLCDKANGYCAELKITEIEGTKYKIEEYDGLEKVIEPKDIKWVKV